MVGCTSARIDHAEIINDTLCHKKLHKTNLTMASLCNYNAHDTLATIPHGKCIKYTKEKNSIVLFHRFTLIAGV